eukprot:3936998-Rhodomonas_salina.1
MGTRGVTSRADAQTGHVSRIWSGSGLPKKRPPPPPSASIYGGCVAILGSAACMYSGVGVQSERGRGAGCGDEGEGGGGGGGGAGGEDEGRRKGHQHRP